MINLLAMCLVLNPAGLEPGQTLKLPASPAFHDAGARISPWAKNIWIDGSPKGRRVIVRASVCLRDAILEEALCLKNTKEHESILAADIQPRKLHAALLLAGAQPGKPATFQPKFRPPTGDVIEIWVEWRQAKGTKRCRLRQWIREVDGGKTLAFDWVFAGSRLVAGAESTEPYYLGDDGDIISVANFPGSVIDLAIQSSSANQHLLFEAFTVRIPPEKTEVFLILKPRKTKKASRKL